MWLEMHGIMLSIFKADWKLYDKSAGLVSNRQILKYALEDNSVVIAFWNGASKGTKNMIEQSRAAGATVHVIMYKVLIYGRKNIEGRKRYCCYGRRAMRRDYD